MFRILFLLVGVFACSTAVILIKECQEHPVLLSAYRLLIAAIVLTPLFVSDCRKLGWSHVRGSIRSSLLPGIFLGLHFISWIIGARMTVAANASLIVNMVPIVMPFFMFFMIREKLTRREAVGTALAMMGVAVLAYFDFNTSREYFWGDICCLVSMLFFSFYLALARKNRKSASTWLYLVPLYYVAGILCFICSLFFLNPIKSYSMKELILILAIAIIPTVIGHSILNHSLRNMRGQVVSIVNMGQFIFASVMAYFFLGELPASFFYITSVFVVAGGVIVITKRTAE